MGTVNVTLGEDARLNLILGQQLENAVTSVVFDFSAWQTAYGSGTLALSVQRPGDDQPYAVTMTTSGTDATWSVTNLDTAYKGVGHIQLTYTVGSAIKKSVIYKFTVYESLGANGEYPSPGQTWQEEIEADIADVKQDLGDLLNLETEDKSNLVAAINEAAQSGGSSLTPTQKQTLMDVINIIGAFTVEDAQDYIDAFNEAWNVVVTGIRLNKSSITFDGFGSEQLRAILIPEDATGTVTWSSSNSNIATVSSNGLVEPVANGSCTITASCEGFTASCSVTATNIPQIFTITTSLSNCTASNSQATVVEGSSYSNTITANQGYEMSAITCTMGGVEQTVSDGVINISEVIGNIVINATAVAEATYTSSTGKTYTKRFTYDNNGSSSPYLVSNFISEYGVMSELEELTLGGNIHDASSATMFNNVDWASYYPSLKRFIVAPDAVYANSSTMNTVMHFNTHYVFSKIPASLIYLQFGKVNQNYYFDTSKYFRGDGTTAGLASNNATGNTNGLNLVIYASQYLANGGFLGALDANTTVEEYLYTDGSVLSA